MLRYRALPIFLLSLLLFSLPLKADVSTVTNLDDSVTSAQAQVQVQEVETPVTCEEGAVLQLNYGNHTSGCNIDTVTDLDTFRFTGSAGDVIRTIVRSPSTMDPILEVRDPEGALIVDERCGGSCAIVIDSTLTLSGTYSISLSEWGADDTGEYTLQLEKIPSLNPVNVTYDAPITGEINPTTDVDFFIFQGSVGSEIRTTVRSPSTMDPILEVRDPEGALIVDERCGGSCAIVIDSTLTLSGTYSISLSEWGADDTGDYELSVACLFGDCFNVAPPPSFTVTATAGAGGAISPSLTTVNSGGVATFTVTPDAGYFASVTGCGGTLSGNTYTTGLITSDCMISASFHPNTSAYIVTAIATANGSITPATQTVNPNATATLTVTPDTGYTAIVAGCGGTLTGTTYTTSPITADCAVVARFTATVTADAPTVTTPDLPDAIAQVPYATYLTAIGGQYPYTYAATGLPPSLTLTAEGILRGTPTTSGPFVVTVTVTDALSQRGSRRYLLTVSTGLTLITVHLPNALVNVPYSQTLAALGGQPPYIFTAAGLPTGLSLTPGGVLSGTPVERNITAVQLTVTDALNQQATKETVLTVRDFTFTEPNPEQPEQTLNGVAEICSTANVSTRTLKVGDPGAPATGPDGVTLLYGLLEITVTGCEPGQTVLTLTTVYPEPLPPDAQYWKYGSTRDNTEPHWYVLPGAIIEGNAITLLIVDGDIGDSDLAVDGNILDPGGPGITLNTIDGAVPAVLPISEPYRADFQVQCDQGQCPADSVYDWSLVAGALPDGLALTGNGATATLSGTPTRVGRYPFTVQVLARSDAPAPTQESYSVVIADPAATTLITHYYVSILEREPEAEGLAYWQGLIADRQAQGMDVKPVFRDMANFFFNSEEYLGRNTTDRQFITNLYLTFFQREPDEDGYAFWLEQLAGGMPRNTAMAGFLYSQEFTDFMQGLGF